MRAFALIFFLVTTALSQEPDLQKKDLSAIKASILVPKDWHFQESTDEGVSIYQITREKVDGDGGSFTAGLILTVTPKVPERAGESASAYAEDIMPSSPEEPGGGELHKSEEGGLKVFRTEYVIEGDPENIQILNLAKANDTTGTLYFFTWQSPQSEDAALKDLREKILGSLVIDPAF